MGRRYKAFEVTRQAICGALKQLMAQKPLERITVAEIMDSCGMRRQHFYYYFTDIYDLLRWAFENEALELARCQVDRQGWQEGFLRLFRYIAENRDICLCALDSLGHEYLKGIFETDTKSIVRSAVRQMALENGFPEDAEREELTTRFLTIAAGGVLEGWLRGELTQTPEELTRQVDEIVQDYIRGVALRLKEPATTRR